MARQATKQKAAQRHTQPVPPKVGAKQRQRQKPGSRRAANRSLKLVTAIVFGLVVVFAISRTSIFNANTGSGPGSGTGAGSGAISALDTADYHSLVFSPTDPNVVFFGHHNGLMRSSDGGRTWQPLVDKTNFDAMGTAINSSNPSQIYIAGHNIFQVSNDGGASWQPIVSNLPGTDLHAFSISPSDPRRLYVFSVDHGVFESGDGGQTWRLLSPQLPGDIMSLAAGGGNPETLYVASMGSGLLRSIDGGKTWIQGPGGVRAVKVDPTSPTTVYAGTGDGLYKSTNSGASWSKLSSFPGSNVAVIGVSPAKSGVVLAIGINGRQGLVYRSEDGGATWGQ